MLLIPHKHTEVAGAKAPAPRKARTQSKAEGSKKVVGSRRKLNGAQAKTEKLIDHSPAERENGQQKQFCPSFLGLWVAN